MLIEISHKDGKSKPTFRTLTSTNTRKISEGIINLHDTKCASRMIAALGNILARIDQKFIKNVKKVKLYCNCGEKL